MKQKVATWKTRNDREATEWDVRLDVNDQLTVQDVINNIKQEEASFLYSLVSGVERADNAGIVDGRAGASSENHIHLAIIMLSPSKRQDVLQLLRGKRKLGDEYCVPRNQKFTYAGWVAHHAKIDWKLEGEPGIRYEAGVLPMDAYNPDVAANVVKMVNKFGDEAMKERFKQYYDIAGKAKLVERYLELKKLVGDDIQEEVYETKEVATQTD